MSSDLRDFLEIPYDRLEEMNLEAKAERLARVASAKIRDKNCRVVRRRGRVYVINKKNPRMKARQG